MRTKNALAALLLGALACSQGLGHELIDRMLGIDAQQSDAEARENWASYCPTGTCQGQVKSYVPDPTLDRTNGPCRPVSYLGMVIRPAAFEPAPCRTGACGPSTCDPPACEPACGPACCDSCCGSCGPFTPVQDLFAGLQTLCASARCCFAPYSCPPMACGPMSCEPVGCESAPCRPAACDPPTCDPPTCGPRTCTAPACGPMACDPCCDPCRRRPLLGMLNQLSCAVSCGLAMLKPSCCDPCCDPCGVPAGCECGGCTGSGGASPGAPEPMPGPSTRPAPEPSPAPEADSTASRLFRWEPDRAVYYQKVGYRQGAPQSYRR